MAEQITVSDLLAAQTERKLTRMREGIIGEMDRLRTELKLVDEALSRKRKPREDASQPRPQSEVIAARVSRDGRFDGLPRDELLALVAEFGSPVKPAEMREFLMGKGIVRKTEAVRVAMNRLVQAGRLTRSAEGRFAVPNSNGNGAHSETEPPLVQAVDLSVSGDQGDGPGHSQD
jgi:hypothetical protein